MADFWRVEGAFRVHTEDTTWATPRARSTLLIWKALQTKTFRTSLSPTHTPVFLWLSLLFLNLDGKNDS